MCEKWCTHGVSTEVPVVAKPDEARDQLARYKATHDLPGEIEQFTDEMVQYHEVVVVVDSEDDLQQWVVATKPYQIEWLGGVHEHGAAPGIADHIRYVVVRANGAEGVIGGAAADDFSPAADGWSLWVRYYPNGRTIFTKPPADKDLIPGRENNILFPLRQGLPPATGSTLPHQQLTQIGSPEIREEMRHWMETAFPDVRTGPSLVSDHVTVAMHLEGRPLGPKARILAPMPGAGEFAHMHIDGSWHLALPAEDRWEVLVKGWGAIHPVAAYGINAIMFYSPRNREELEHVKNVVQVAYRYAIGELY